MTRIDDILGVSRIIAVLTVEKIVDAVPLARALCAGGLPLLEVTLRTPASLEALRAIAAEVPEAVVGAGTVMLPEELVTVAEAGARFAVSPGATIALLEAGRSSTLPYLPAVATPSEIMEGMARGYTRFKLFPAERLGGPSALKGLGGPFPTARFCCTGGITLETLPDYLATANVVSVGGSWMAPSALVAQGRWAEITALARETCRVVSRADQAAR